MELWSQIMLVAGAVLVLEAVPYLGFPELLQRAAERIAQIPPGRLRRGGLALLFLGLALLGLRWALLP